MFLIAAICQLKVLELCRIFTSSRTQCKYCRRRNNCSGPILCLCCTFFAQPGCKSERLETIQEGEIRDWPWDRADTGSHFVTRDPSDPSVNWPMTHATHNPWPRTHDLRIMIIAYRLHTCCANARHVATHNQNQVQSVRHYVVIATKPVHRLQIRQIVHN